MLVLNPQFETPPYLAPGGQIDPARDINFILNPKFQVTTFAVPYEKLIEVSVVFTPPPAEPFDVPVELTDPPAEPFDVPIELSDPPAEPFDIPVELSDPPADPVDVPIELSDPPADPVDVPITPTPGPAEPFDVPTDPVDPPADPFDVPVDELEFRERILVPSIDPTPPPRPVGRQSIRAASRDMLAPGGYLDPEKDINLHLHLTSGYVGEIISLIDSTVKLAMSPKDQLAQGMKLGSQAAIAGFKGAVADLAQTSAVTFNMMIDRQLGNNLYSPDKPYTEAAKQSVFSTTANDITDRTNRLKGVFSRNNNNLSSLPKASVDGNSIDVRAENRELSRATFFHVGGQVPAGFDEDRADGSIVTKNSSEKPSDIISDDAAYVPLSFTDMRSMSTAGSVRTVYFRPFITSLSEDYGPEYDKRSYFGRSDHVVNYMSTIRTVFLGFELHAFYPEDLPIMYKKLKWLSSLVYPQYDREMLFKAGPVCRIRVGDIISSRSGRGLPGVIDSLNFDYTDAIWEVKKGSKAPRTIHVTVSFHVLHDSPIGIDSEGMFGGIGNVDPATGLFTPGNAKANQKAFRDIGDIEAVLEDPNTLE